MVPPREIASRKDFCASPVMSGLRAITVLVLGDSATRSGRYSGSPRSDVSDEVLSQ